MFKMPCINPLDNLIACQNILDEIVIYKRNNWAIGQEFPNGGPDSFTYFFTVRLVAISAYLRGTISIGEPSAYDKNIEAMKIYMNSMLEMEVYEVRKIIRSIKKYQDNNWAIGEKYPDGGADKFVYFFGVRNLDVAPYLRGTVNIGEPTAYEENIETLVNYLRTINLYKQVL